MPTEGSVAKPCQTMLRRLCLPFSFVSSRRLFAVAPWFPSSTMSNSIDSRSFPSTTARPNYNDVPLKSSTVSNSIDVHSSMSNSTMVLSVPKFNNVELCRHSYNVSVCVFVACQQCRTPSTNCMPSPVLLNSISTCPRWNARQQCRTPSTHHKGASVQQCRTPSTAVSPSLW